MKKPESLLPVTLTFVLSIYCCQTAMADGLSIDKIYHPYVDALEKELEYRSIYPEAQSRSENPAQIHKLSLGTSFSDRWFGEFYLVGEKDRRGNFELEAYELELKWQLSEQGEYFADWGLLFEYENETEADIEEISVGILSEKEWGRWSGTANLHFIQEWGDDIDDEFETAFAWQSRYRYSQALEPGFEFYTGQTATGLGPLVQGAVNLGIRKNLHWEAGLIFGLDNKSPDQTFRFLLEYEF
tara:strand:- start:48913 stop:49638 length:726 start_codon:yes stop_codon:yes gene_type:complete